MKKICTLILVAGWALNAYSQKVIQLEETRLNFVPTAEIMFEDYENGIVHVKEKFSRQFEKDAIRFMKENFDIHRYLDMQQLLGGDIIVTAKTAKGFIMATYDDDGKIVRNFQKFRNIVMPAEVRNQVFLQHTGWSIRANSYSASGKGEYIDKERWLVKLEKGKEKKKVRIDPARPVRGIASID